MTPKKLLLKIRNLYVGVSGKTILRGVNLKVAFGEVHAIMGPNGSGKSSLANVLMGHPTYKVLKGQVSFSSRNFLKLRPEERAKAGLFLAFQSPTEIAGVSLAHLLRSSLATLSGAVSFAELGKRIGAGAQALKIDPIFLQRGANENLSGGEKKKSEILQMILLRPKLAILDEIDSGLDVDSLKIIAGNLRRLREENPKISLVLITHHFRILEYINPDFVHVMLGGKIVKSGGSELAVRLEEEGYGWVKDESKK